MGLRLQRDIMDSVGLMGFMRQEVNARNINLLRDVTFAQDLICIFFFCRRLKLF